jgi:hypothetical protein
MRLDCKLFRTLRNLFFVLFHKIGAGLEENVFISNPEVLHASKITLPDMTHKLVKCCDNTAEYQHDSTLQNVISGQFS